MKKSKLYYYLSQMSASERQTFRDHLAAPSLNSEPALLHFFSLFEKAFFSEAAEITSDSPTSDSDISRETFFAKVWPNRAYEPNLLRVTMSKLLAEWKEFIALEALRRDETLKERLFLETLQARRWDRYLGPLLAQAARRHAKAAARDSLWYRHQLALDELRHDFEARQPRQNSIDALHAMSASLDNYFMISKLGLVNAVANQRQILDTQDEIQGIEELLAMVARSGETAVPLVRILHCVHGTLTRPTTDAATDFQALFALLHDHIHTLSPAAGIGMTTYAINFCLRRIRAGEPDYQQSLEALYKLLLDRRLLLENGRMPAAHMKAIVRLFARLGQKTGDFAWVTRFVRKYGKAIVGDAEGHYGAFNRGVVLFYEGEYEGAARIFFAHWKALADVFYRLDARAYLLMCYFELEWAQGWEALRENEGWGSFEDEAAAFRMYLSRSKGLSAVHKRGYLQMVKALKQIAAAQGKSMKAMEKALKQVRLDLDAAGSFPNRDWILMRAAR
ncbi:MAG: hypothetical protein AAF570_08590 [Bacteroidota bacterium]